jgi:hypothetical protein
MIELDQGRSRTGLAILDPDVNSVAINEDDLSRIASELGQLAAGLEPNEAAEELKLREEYLSVERQLFPTRLERAKVLLRFKAIYGPKRMWSQFLRITRVARRTAYDLLAAAEEEAESTLADRAKSAQSKTGRNGRKSPPQYDFDVAVDKAVSSVNRVLKGFSKSQRESALKTVFERLSDQPVKGKRDNVAMSSKEAPALVQGRFNLSETLIVDESGSYSITPSDPVADMNSTEAA